MDRIGSFSFQTILVSAIQRNQANLSATQIQLATGKKAATYRDLGVDAMPSLGAHSMLAREEAYGEAGNRVSQAVDRYDSALTHLHASVTALYDSIGNAIALGEARGVDGAMEATFGAMKQTLNLNQSGEYLFAGGPNDTPPFVPDTLADLATLPVVADAFGNDSLRTQARVSEGMDLTYGLLADEVGTKLAESLRSLQATGPVEGTLTIAQQNDLEAIFSELRTALDQITDVQAANGRNGQQVAAYQERADVRMTQLESVVSKQEDVDLTEVVSRLLSQQVALEASYQAFSQIREMSLVNYL